MQRNLDFPKPITRSLDSDLIDVLSTWDGISVLSEEQRTKIKKVIELFSGKEDKDEKASSSVQCKNLYGIGASFTQNEATALINDLLREPPEEKSDVVPIKNKAEVILIYSRDPQAKEFPERVMSIIKVGGKAYFASFEGVYGPADICYSMLFTHALFELNHYTLPDHPYPLAFRVIGIADRDVYHAPHRFPKAQDILANLKVVKEGKVNTVRQITNNNVSSNTSSLESAFVSGNPDAVEFLIKKGADPYYSNVIALGDFACTNKLQKMLTTSLLQIGAKRGMIKEVQELLAGGIAVDALHPETGATALHYAAQGNQFVVISVLLMHRADIEARCSMGFTPLHFAARYNSINAAKILIDRGANIEAVADKGITPLHLAVASGSLVVAACLVGKGADLFALSSDGYMPFDYAKSPEIKKFIAESMLKGAIRINDTHLAKYIVRLTGKSAVDLLSKFVSHTQPEVAYFLSYYPKASAKMRRVLAQEKLRLQMTAYKEEKEDALKKKKLGLAEVAWFYG